MSITADSKILIVLQAGTDTHEGRARALHSVSTPPSWPMPGPPCGSSSTGPAPGGSPVGRRAMPQRSRAARMFAALRDRGRSAVRDHRFLQAPSAIREQLVEAGAAAGQYLDHPGIVRHVGDGFVVWIL
ncbi:MAG: hypothetical protein U0838_02795 [Chloroflexota bacterium]